MSSLLARQVLTALSAFSSHTRLYELKLPNQRADSGLMVEAFAADERLQGIAIRELNRTR
ncbi:MAG: Type secretion system tip protein VgrG [Massilia sp.]|jgi:type VI secretion system secreted protein VgrG|nr:Type secretion system tip protein VgrG [Massilia sp.]